MTSKKTASASSKNQTGDINNRDGKVIVAFRDVNIKETNITNTVTTNQSTTSFADVYHFIESHPQMSETAKKDIKAEVVAVEKAIKKKNRDEDAIAQTLRNIGRMAPDILEVALAAILNPITVPPLIAQKIAAKAREK